MLPPGIQVLERGWLSANNILLFDGDVATLIPRVRGPFEEAQRELAASTPPPILERGVTRGSEALCA